MRSRTWAPALLAIAFGIVLGPLVNGCGGGGGSTGGDPSPTTTGKLSDTGFSTNKADFEPFNDKLLALFTRFSTVIDFSEAEGARVTISPDHTTLTVEFINQAKGTIAGPYVLQGDPDFTGGFFGEGLAGFGREDLQIIARVDQDENGENEVALYLGIPKREMATSVYQGNNLVDKRVKLKRHWTELSTKDNICNSVVKFGQMIQDIADTAVANPGLGKASDQVLDDMADLFVPETYHKELYISSDKYVFTEAIWDPGTFCAGTGGLSGFGNKYNQGEGRFRHFSANAALSRYLNGYIVSAVAKTLGGDWEWNNDPDNKADRATNALGREFFTEIRLLEVSGKIKDGKSVRKWIIENFGEDVPAYGDSYVVLDADYGPYKKGDKIGLCRISRACKVSEAETNCDHDHMHSSEAEGITIDEKNGPYVDQNKPGCGYGKVYHITYTP